MIIVTIVSVFLPLGSLRRDLPVFFKRHPADFPAVLLSYSKSCLPDIVSIVTNFFQKGKDFLPLQIFLRMFPLFNF